MVPSGSNVRIISNGESGYNNPTQNITLTGTTGKLVQLLFVYLNGMPIWIIYNLISF